MKDLYKQLGVVESCGETELRAALAGAAPELREAAEFILLDPGRRAVYDRNRRVLATIGHLRAHLGLNLTRFWPRSRFADFTTSLTPVPPEAPGGANPVDPMRIASAFGVEVPGYGNRRRRGRRRIAVVVAVAIATGLALALWYFL